MKSFLRKNIISVSFTLAGGVAGFLYWKFIGCMSGTCFIKSVWYMSTLYGMAAGYIAGSLLADLIKSFRKEKQV